LSNDEDIDDFFSAFGISSTETYGIIPKTTVTNTEEKIQLLFCQFIAKLNVDFSTDL
jgi:type II restriction enzyme